MGLLGVVTTLAMWNSDEFESHMLHHSNHGVMGNTLPFGGRDSGSIPAWGVKMRVCESPLINQRLCLIFFGHGFSESENGSGSFE